MEYLHSHSPVLPEIVPSAVMLNDIKLEWRHHRLIPLVFYCHSRHITVQLAGLIILT